MAPSGLAETATALLAVKATGSFADEVGRAAWRRLESLYSLVRRRATDDHATEAAVDSLALRGDAQSRASVMRSIAAWAASDAQFRDQLTSLLDDIGREPWCAPLMAQALDHAKQVNIGRDNACTINL